MKLRMTIMIRNMKCLIIDGKQIYMLRAMMNPLILVKDTSLKVLKDCGISIELQMRISCSIFKSKNNLIEIYNKRYNLFNNFNLMDSKHKSSLDFVRIN
jgi:hypothetical protein